MKEALHLILPWVNKIGKIRDIEDSVPVFLQTVVAKVKLTGCMWHKRIGGVQIKSGMAIEPPEKGFKFQATHVRDVGRKVRKAIQDFLEVRYADKGASSHGSGAGMQEDPLFPLQDHLVERKPPTVTGGELLDNTLQLEPQNLRMIENPLRHDALIFPNPDA